MLSIIEKLLWKERLWPKSVKWQMREDLLKSFNEAKINWSLNSKNLLIARLLLNVTMILIYLPNFETRFPTLFLDISLS